MGTAVAPNYANLFMERFVRKALNNWLLRPMIYLQFIDDIFRENEFSEFITHLNGIHPAIKFTHELSPSEINFRDSTVKVNQDRGVYTTLHEELTDTHLYLHYSSSHHSSSITKGPYGQFLRLRRICTYGDDFQTNYEKLITYYIKREYPEKALCKHYKRGFLIHPRPASRGGNQGTHQNPSHSNQL